MTQNLDHLRDWIGNTESHEERIAVQPIHGLRALLDKPEVPKEGDPLQPMDHWVLFKPRAPQSEIGPDGHPKRGGFLPPVPLPRRMFAGCRIDYHAPLKIGEVARKLSTIDDVQIKEGRTGTLVFCTVKHETKNEAGAVCLTEIQDIVYRDNPPASAKGSSGNSGKTNPARDDHAWIRRHHPDPVMLFRYSAVTFNGHRIHYDRTYVTEVEGYPGLIVHGPLTATLILELALDNNPGRPVAHYRFQARAPLFDTAPFHVAGKPTEDGQGAELWSITPEGNVGTLAEVRFG